jgi:hypothetical protein
MLLKSSLGQLPRSLDVSCPHAQMLYSPYLGSRSSSIKLCIDSGEGRTKQRQRRWRIFSRFWLSSRLRSGQSCIAVEANMASCVLGEVDLMVEEGGLCGCRRHYGDLGVFST